MSALVTWIKKWYQTSSNKQKLTVFLLAFSLLITGLLLAFGGGSTTSADPLGSTPLYFASAFVKLLVVLLLIVGSSMIFRRWQQQVGTGGKPSRQMRVLETVRLSPKQALHLVVIGDQKLLIGATDQSVSLISSIEHSMNPVPVEDAPLQSGFEFGSLLQSFSLNLSTESIKGKE